MSTSNTQANVRQPKSRAKPPRSVGLVIRPEGYASGVLRIRVGESETDYVITPMRSDFGRAFRLEKVGTDAGETYHVCLDGAKTTCDCKGFARWSHCKHADGLTALVAAGRL
jgi:hypothetical protein